MNISHNIKYIRLSAKKRQKEFAAIIGATEAQIKSFEGGKTKPNLLLKQKIAEFAKIPIADLEYKNLAENSIKIDTSETNDASEKFQDTILNLSESVRKMAESNAVLASTNNAVVSKMLSTEHDQKETLINVDARFSDLLEVIGKVGTKKGWWQSHQEAAAELSKLFFGKKANSQAVSIQTG